MRSEKTKDMNTEELKNLRSDVEAMDEEALAEFRNSFDPDEMGFDGEEGAIDE